MADLPDYYTQAQISEAEAAKFKGGLDANKSPTPVSRDIYIATDTHILYVCITDGAWTGFDAATLTQGILTLYANMAGGGFRITNIADPLADQDAATGAFVLAIAALYLALAGGTMTGNIIMGGNKVTGLGAPTAQDHALRYGRAEIRNAEIAAAAAIVYSKLSLALSIVNADIAAAAAIAYSKLNLTGAIKAADIEAAAGIPLSKLEAAVCSETEAKGFVTKEFFVPVTFGTDIGYYGNFSVAYCNAVGENAYIAFHTPHDFTAIVEAVIIVIPRATKAAADWEIRNHYAANGEGYSTNSEVDGETTYNVSAYELFEVDISGILSALAAGDYVGIRLTQSEAGHDVNVIGVRFKYS